MKKLNSYVISADLMNFLDKKTGEVKDMTRIYYTVEREDSEKYVGQAIMECYKQGDHVKAIQPKCRKVCQLIIDEKPLKNGSKYIVTQIDEVKI